MSENLEQQLDSQYFANGYQLVNGVVMHAENLENFHVPPEVIKRHVRPGQFIELRIDSPRFSVHEDTVEQCFCPSCNGELTKPILKHNHPASLVPLPEQKVPSRGWGEDFWVRVTQKSGSFFRGVVDNPLVETRLHELKLGDQIVFQKDHIPAVHDVHRQELVAGMNIADLQELARWVSQMRQQG